MFVVTLCVSSSVSLLAICYNAIQAKHLAHQFIDKSDNHWEYEGDDVWTNIYGDVLAIREKPTNVLLE
jgi:hypothetical protein